MYVSSLPPPVTYYEDVGLLFISKPEGNKETQTLVMTGMRLEEILLQETHQAQRTSAA